MAKFSVEIIVDTDPDGENQRGSSLFSPSSLMILLPFIDKMVRQATKPTDAPAPGGPTDDIGGPAARDERGPLYGAGSSAAQVLRDLGRSAERTVARESSENG